MSSIVRDEKKKKHQNSAPVTPEKGLENMPAMAPPPMQFKASSLETAPEKKEAPAQFKWGTAGGSYEGDKNDALKAKGYRGEFGAKEWGEQPEEKSVKKAATLYSDKVEGSVSTLSEKEQEAALKGPHAAAGGNAGYSIGSNGLKASASAEAKAMLVDYEQEFPLTFDHSLFGEDMQMYLSLILKGSVGVEAAAQIEANVAKAAASGDPEAVNESAIKAGVEGQAGAFAGAKVSVGGKAAYKWKRKDLAAYQDKIANSAQMVSDYILMINPPLGWLLKQLNGTETAEFLIQSLFGVGGGAAAVVDLLSAEASAEGSAGIGAEAKGGIGFNNGKFSFNASANATYGLGFGTSAKVAVDILEGVKFGLIAGGEIWSRAKPYLAGLLNPTALMGSIGGLFSKLMGWFSADDKVREMVAAGAHTLAGPKERGEMLDTLMSGWTGEEDQDAILDILEYSKQKGDLNSVLARAGISKSSILRNLDGAQDKRARNLLSA